MFKRLKKAFAPWLTCGFALSSLTFATSIIVDVRKDRIIVAADSLADNTNLFGTSRSHDFCKIALLGKKFAFAETGQEGYKHATLNDDLPEWNGTTEAIRAYEKVSDHDLQKIADTWGQSVTRNFQLFFSENHERVRQLAARQGGVLLLGIFAGAGKDGELVSYIVVVNFNEKSQGFSPIGYQFSPPPIEPYSSNFVTKELMDGQTERAKQIQAEWKKRKSINVFDLYEYLIQQTAPIDPTVGGPVNILKITGSQVEWVHNRTCKHPPLVTVKPSKPVKPMSPKKK